MQTRATLAMPLVLLFALVGRSSAQDPVEIVDKAIKAYGGEENLRKLQHVRTKSRGKMDFDKTVFEFEQDGLVSINGMLKTTIRLKTMNMVYCNVVVFDGRKGWVSTNGETKELDDKQITNIKEDLYCARLGQLGDLKDTSKYQLAALGEIEVNGKPAVGVKVSSKDHKDVKIYFDKAEGLLVKMERRTIHLVSLKEQTEERITTSWQRVDGVPTPKTVLVKDDGKDTVLAELYEVKLLPKIEESEFAKP